MRQGHNQIRDDCCWWFV